MPKSKHQVLGRVRATYEFIQANRDRHSVQMMCRVLEVAPSGYYDWVLQPVSNRAQEDARLHRLIRASFVASHGIYGACRSPISRPAKTIDVGVVARHSTGDARRLQDGCYGQTSPGKA